MGGEAAVRGVRVRAVTVPLDPPLQTAGGEIAVAPLLLIDLHADDDLIGRSYLFCFTPVVQAALARLVVDVVASLAGTRCAPLDVRRVLVDRFRLLRPQGLLTMAISGIDVAVWDIHARCAGAALAHLLGAAVRPVPAYASLRRMRPAEVAREAAERAEQGFTRFKVKVGLADLDTDLQVIRALREAAGADVEIAVDYNQSLTVAEALRRIARLDDEGLLWVEEPTHADDHAGHREIRRRVTTPIQLGESWWSTQDFATSIVVGAGDLAMIDVMRIGGVTGWCEAAGLLAAHNIPLSSHLFPEVSAHLLAASASAHLLEHLDVAGPVLASPARVEGGAVVPHDQPGVGIEWNEPVVQRLVRDSATLEWFG